MYALAVGQSSAQDFLNDEAMLETAAATSVDVVSDHDVTVFPSCPNRALSERAAQLGSSDADLRRESMKSSSSLSQPERDVTPKSLILRWSPSTQFS